MMIGLLGGFNWFLKGYIDRTSTSHARSCPPPNPNLPTQPLQRPNLWKKHPRPERLLILMCLLHAISHAYLDSLMHATQIPNHWLKDRAFSSPQSLGKLVLGSFLVRVEHFSFNESTRKLPHTRPMWRGGRRQGTHYLLVSSIDQDNILTSYWPT